MWSTLAVVSNPFPQQMRPARRRFHTVECGWRIGDCAPDAPEETRVAVIRFESDSRSFTRVHKADCVSVNRSTRREVRKWLTVIIEQVTPRSVNGCESGTYGTG